MDSEGTSTFTFDNWDRLVTAQYPDFSSESFKWDLNGNRTEHTNGEGTTDYHYDQSRERLLQLSRGGSVITSFVHDGRI